MKTGQENGTASQDMIRRLREMQRQIIHGTDFFGKTAERLEQVEAQLGRLINASASVLNRLPEWPHLSDAGTAKAQLAAEILSASRLAKENV